MIQNINTGEIIVINSIDLMNNYAYITKKADFFAIGVNSIIHVGNLQKKINDSSIDQLSTINLSLINCVELSIIELSDYSNYIQKFSFDWQEEAWEKRFFLTKDQAIYLIRNYKDWYDTLYTSPINPQYELTDGILIYVNTVLPQAQILFDSMGIIIENKN